MKLVRSYIASSLEDRCSECSGLATYRLLLQRGTRATNLCGTHAKMLMNELKSELGL